MTMTGSTCADKWIAAIRHLLAAARVMLGAFTVREHGFFMPPGAIPGTRALAKNNDEGVVQ